MFTRLLIVMCRIMLMERIALMLTIRKTQR